MDVRRLLHTLLAPALGVAMSVPLAAQPADASSPARAFVTVHYFEGVPFVEARALGREALPDLYAVLQDRELETYWANTVGVIGMIGDPSSVEPLLAFLAGLSGEVSVDAFRAALQVMPALGHLHRSGSADALGVLENHTDDEYWRRADLRMRYGRYADAALGEVMGRMAILGLGVAGTPEAAAHLASLDTPSLRPDWTDNVSEALVMNARIRSKGADAVFAPSGL